MAAFQVFMFGRFWVFTEDLDRYLHRVISEDHVLAILDSRDGRLIAIKRKAVSGEVETQRRNRQVVARLRFHRPSSPSSGALLRATATVCPSSVWGLTFL